MGETIILGAGLAGLSTAFHLGNGYRIFEKEQMVGGMARSVQIDGFTFDLTGHLLHMRDQYTKDLVGRLLPDAFDSHARRAHIYSSGVYTEYPFQANTFGLPKEVVKECIAGFVETCVKHGANGNGNGHHKQSPLTFEDWVRETFGSGIAKYFMLPYNQKLWRVPLAEITADWVSWSVPRPTLDEILNGALGINNKAFGYNPSFLYPKRGGIGQLSEALARRVENLCLNRGAVEISLEDRTVRFEDDSVYRFESLVSTIPLLNLLRLIHDLPDEIRQAGEKLRYISVYDVNLGVKRPNISDKHWIYFPEPEFVFYRVGFPMNYAPNTVPTGCSSMYVEVSHLPGDQISEEQLLQQVVAGLIRCGILRHDDELLVRQVIDLKCAYVIHDEARQQALEVIRPYLESQRIFSTGRYGNWEYSSMEGAILNGREIARRLKAPEPVSQQLAETQ